MRTLIVLALLALGTGPAAAQENKDDIFEIDPLTIDPTELLNCGVDAATYNTFALSLSDDAHGAKARGWKEVKSGNPFLSQYRLPKPIDVIGGTTETYRTQTIVFSNSAILAVLDIADPKPLSDSLGMTDYLNFPDKFLGQKIISEQSTEDADLGMRFTVRISQNVSTVTSHPGKTLYGCSYRIETEDLPAKK